MVSENFRNYVSNHFNNVWGFVDFRIPEVLFRIFDSVPLSHGVAEIGVYHGKFFLLLRNLLENNKPSLALDIFEAQNLNIDNSGGGDPTKSFFDNLKTLDPFEGDLVNIVKGNSTSKPIQNLVTDYYSVFSIDGGHTSQHCYNDLLFAQEKTVDSGVIILDDFFRIDWPGVTEGVFNYLSTNPQFVPFLSAFNKLFLCHFVMHEYFLSLVGVQFKGQRVVMKDYEVLFVEDLGH